MAAEPAGGFQVEAAGGVLWRPAPGAAGVEVALVHRPKYDDWSVPKGKLAAGEHVVLGALREIEEETGVRGVPGPPLGSVSYLKDGLPKRVRYWAVQARQGRFEPNAEVDQLMWLPPREALAHLYPDRDRGVVAAFAATPRPTRAVLLVRHGTAGDRKTWPGDDRDRPLDDHGREQAARLADILDAYDVARAGAADVLRCLDTIGRFAARRGIPVTSEPLLSETGVSDNPRAAVARLLDVVARDETTAVCTQRGALAAVLGPAFGALGRPDLSPPQVRKGGIVALHLSVPDARLATVELIDPPV